MFLEALNQAGSLSSQVMPSHQPPALQKTVTLVSSEFQEWHNLTPPLYRGNFQPKVFRANDFDETQVKASDFHFYGGGQHLFSVDSVISNIANHNLSTELIACVSLGLSHLMQWEEWYNANICPIEKRAYCLSFDTSNFLQAVLPFESLRRYALPTPSVLEVGPGSGYFALLASLAGFSVFTLDISFGYNVWQEIFFRHVANTKKPNLIQRLNPGSVLTPVGSIPKVAAVCINHAINEFSPHSLAFLLEVLNRTFSVEESPVILLHGWGWGSRTNQSKNFDTAQILGWYGYEMAYHVDNWRSFFETPTDVMSLLPGTCFRRTTSKSVSNIALRTDSKDSFELDLSVSQVPADEDASRLRCDSSREASRRTSQALFDAIGGVNIYGKPLEAYESPEMRWFGFCGLNSHPTRLYPSDRTDGKYI